MREYPILCTTSVVRAILEGRQTQDRRPRQPWWQAGDRLYVREAWHPWPQPPGYVYRATWEGEGFKGGWKPSIHMPKVAARIWLRVLDMRMERLQDISDADCITEGIQPMEQLPGPIGQVVPESLSRWRHAQLHAKFAELWDLLYSKRTCGWDTNPLVWVTVFEVEETAHG